MSSPRFQIKYLFKIYAISISEACQKQTFMGVLKNLAKLTGKHLCQSLLFNEVTD